MVHKVATSLLACAALLAVQVRQVRAADDEPQVVPYDQDDDGDEYGSAVKPRVRERPDAPVRPAQPREGPRPAPRPMPAPLPAAPGTAAPLQPPPAPGTAALPVPPPVVPLPARRTPSEGGLGVMQFVLGVAAFGGTILLGAGSESEELIVLSVLLAPMSTGLMVCLAGKASEHNQGRCGPSIGFSYLGAAAGLLVGFVVAAGSGFDDSGVLVIAGAPVLGSALGSVLAWHSFKTPLPQPRLRAYAPELPRAVLRDRDRAPHLTVPVLSLSF